MIRKTIAAVIVFSLASNASLLWAHAGHPHARSTPVAPNVPLSDPPSAAGASVGNGESPNYLFPDIVPFVEEDEIYLQNWDISGDRLRVETVYANFGDGLFEIRSGDDIGGGQINVVQRVYINNDFGSEYEDFTIDTAVSNHSGHGHIHFEDFSRFTLHEMTVDNGVIGVGDEVAGTVKTSYALSANRGPLYPEYVGAPKYTSTNNGTHQRISVGYGDRYSRGTEGQHFSIAGLPTDQLYWLRQHADPDNNVMETDETNNMFEILIDLTQQGVGLRRPDDTFLQPGDSASLISGLPGDLNGSGAVDGEDWMLYVGSLGASDPGDTDLNGDGVNDHADFLIFKGLFEAANPDASSVYALSNVPEPGALILMSVAGFVILAYLLRRKRDYAITS